MKCQNPAGSEHSATTVPRPLTGQWRSCLPLSGPWRAGPLELSFSFAGKQSRHTPRRRLGNRRCLCAPCLRSNAAGHGSLVRMRPVQRGSIRCSRYPVLSFLLSQVNSFFDDKTLTTWPSYRPRIRTSLTRRPPAIPVPKRHLARRTAGALPLASPSANASSFAPSISRPERRLFKNCNIHLDDLRVRGRALGHDEFCAGETRC
jgi:hypothetical protein